MLTRKLNQRGDTIVEVLMAVGIVGVVLTGAFVSARNSQAVTRRSQERGEALKTAERVVEELRQLATNQTVSPNIFTDTTTDTYCIDKAGNPHVVTVGSYPALDADTFSDTVYNVAAGDKKGSASCPRLPNGGESYYYPVVVRTSANNFIVHVRWPRFSGGENQEVTIGYRAYQ